MVQIDHISKILKSPPGYNLQRVWGQDASKCPFCGSDDVTREEKSGATFGIYSMNRFTVTEYTCKNCGSVWKGEEVFEDENGNM